MHQVKLRPRALGQYRTLLRPELREEVEEVGADLRDMHVVHVNATADGGGVAELLRSMVPLMLGLGIRAEWHVLDAGDAFFEATKKLHNMLQGAEGELSGEERFAYLAQSSWTAERMGHIVPDIWMIHDPQPAAAGAVQNSGVPRIWRSHIDTSRPNEAAANFLRPFVEAYESHIYSHDSYRFSSVTAVSTAIIEPAIDPLTVKNRLMERSRARAVVARIGVDVDRPMITQAARLDPWKDPCGVIDAFRIARRSVPGLQLVMLGVIEAQDDPEAVRVAVEVQEYAGGDPDIHIFTDRAVIGPEEVAAVQSYADVVLQKSLREGFGLSATEAMWKGRPVIVGNVGGLRVQVENGVSGYCVDSVEECAERIVEILSNRELSRRMGRAARERIRDRYLLPRLLRDELRVYRDVLVGRRGVPAQRTAAGPADRGRWGASAVEPGSEAAS